MEKEVLLKVDGLSSGYSGLKIIDNVSIEVNKHEVALILGSNGSGKTTLLKTISGLVHSDTGSIHLQNIDLTSKSIRDRRKHGLTYVSDETYFPTLSVKENLSMSLGNSKINRSEKLEEVFSIFPELKERSISKAGSLSGGQRKMLIIGMAIASDPVLTLLDEPSGGLSPLFVDKIIDAIDLLKKSGKSILLAEQNIEFMSLADRLYVMDSGKISFSGDPEKAIKNDEIRRAYFNL